MHVLLGIKTNVLSEQILYHRPPPNHSIPTFKSAGCVSLVHSSQEVQNGGAGTKTARGVKKNI